MICSSNFPVYWNVPTESCYKYGVNFSNLKAYGLVQNNKDKFRGEKITILYDPGFFPAVMKSGDRNGGVPQKGNLTRHLELFKKELDFTIHDPGFKGFIWCIINCVFN